MDERLFGVPRRTGVPPRIVFLGNLSVPHNVDAALFAVREVWPAIRALVPEARFLLVGADPVPAVREAAAAAGVEVTGRLPDLLDLWASADVMLAPLRFSTGIQNKVLEAMAAGVPVVTTPPVAAALGTLDGEHLRTANGAAGLAAAVAETLRDPAAAAKRAERAREHVRAHFSWDTIVQRAGAGGRFGPDYAGCAEAPGPEEAPHLLPGDEPQAEGRGAEHEHDQGGPEREHEPVPDRHAGRHRDRRRQRQAPRRTAHLPPAHVVAHHPGVRGHERHLRQHGDGGGAGRAPARDGRQVQQHVEHGDGEDEHVAARLPPAGRDHGTEDEVHAHRQHRQHHDAHRRPPRRGSRCRRTGR